MGGEDPYGDCVINDANGCGVVFKLDTTGKETVLYTFTGGTDGGLPMAGLVRDSAGNLYGTTYYGGDLSCYPYQPYGCGVVFQVDTTGHESVLYTFTNGADGGFPYAGLIRDAAGNFYGTTMWGGTHGAGVVFELDTTGHETVLYTFCAKTNCTDGGNPVARLIRDAAGNFYGTTEQGGGICKEQFGNCGVVFKLTP